MLGVLGPLGYDVLLSKLAYGVFYNRSPTSPIGVASVLAQDGADHSPAWGGVIDSGQRSAISSQQSGRTVRSLPVGCCPSFHGGTRISGWCPTGDEFAGLHSSAPSMGRCGLARRLHLRAARRIRLPNSLGNRSSARGDPRHTNGPLARCSSQGLPLHPLGAVTRCSLSCPISTPPAGRARPGQW